jgi:hypothetical protein
MANHQIFICFSSKDTEVAHQIVAFLERHGLTCWISLRDVEPGANYQESIVHALEASKVVVFLFSDNSSRSSEIRKELSLAASDKIIVIPVRLAPITPSGALRYELATRQWIDGFPNPEEAFGKLLASVRDALRGGASAGFEGAAATVERLAPPPAKQIAPAVKLGNDEFEAVRAMLARHIGPIAKVLVTKASNEASSAEEFCERLAAHIAVPAERATFLQALRTRLATKT